MKLRVWHWLALLVCGAMTAIIVVRARELSVSAATVPPVVGTNENAVIPIAEAELESLREQTKQLAMLRNEVMQLRAKKSDLESARRDNAALSKAEPNGPVLTHQAPPGFVSKDKLNNVGFATPDDTVQTFFWALRDGNFRALLNAMSPSDPDRQRMEKMSPEKFAEMEGKMARHEKSDEMQNFADFGIRSREIISDDAMVLHVGSSLTTNTIKFRMERTSDGWKLRAPMSP